MTESKLRIIFAGTPDFAAKHLTALIKNQHNVVAVLTQPDKPAGRGKKIQANPVKVLAQVHNIPILQPLKLRNAEIQQKIAAFKPDLIIVVAYGMILPKALLTIAQFGCINVHASLLPRWRGAAPIQYAILNGDNKTGVTIMQMDAGLDTGDIIKQKQVDIDTEDTTATLTLKLAGLGVEVLLKTVALLQKQHKLIAYPQLSTGITYAHKINKEMAQINWHEAAEISARKIRAFNPWPMAFTVMAEEKIKVHKAKVVSSQSLSEYNTSQRAIVAPGEIIFLGKDGIDVATTNGILRLEKLQFTGKNPLNVAEILNSKKDWFLTWQKFQ